MLLFYKYFAALLLFLYVVIMQKKRCSAPLIFLVVDQCRSNLGAASQATDWGTEILFFFTFFNDTIRIEIQ
jgi:hypothetical protein